MRNRKKMRAVLILVLLALAVVLLLPWSSSLMPLFWVLTAILVVSAAALLYFLSKNREIAREVQIISINSSSQTNPNQYMTRNGYVCAGSDSRCQVTFQLSNDTRVVLSLSGRQAAPLACGMRGTLQYNDNVFLSFEPDTQ